VGSSNQAVAVSALCLREDYFLREDNFREDYLLREINASRKLLVQGNLRGLSEGVNHLTSDV
jgi:hypothetical protein